MNIKSVLVALMLSTATVTFTLPTETIAANAVSEKDPFEVSKKTAAKQIGKAEIAKERADKARNQCKDKNKLAKNKWIYDRGIDFLQHAKTEYDRKDYNPAGDWARYAVYEFDAFRKRIK